MSMCVSPSRMLLCKDLLDQEGFTFLELILVIVLLSTLLSVATLNYSSLQEQTLTDLAQADLQVLRAAIKSYYIKHQTYPDSLNALIINPNERYLDELPRDKFGSGETYGYSKDQRKIWSRGPDRVDDHGVEGKDIVLTFGP